MTSRWLAALLTLLLGARVAAQSSPAIVPPAAAQPAATAQLNTAPAQTSTAPAPAQTAPEQTATAPVPADTTATEAPAAAPQPSAAGTPLGAAAPVAPISVAPQPTAAASEEQHARRTLQAFVLHDHDARVYGGYGMILSGAALFGAGLAADFGYQRSYGEPLWIIGIVVGAGGLFNLVRHGPFENLAKAAEGRSAEELKQLWSDSAREKHGARMVSGVVNLIVGAVAAGAGGAIAAGLGDMSDKRRQDWSIGLLASGGGVMAGGLGSLLIESSLETSFRAAYGTEPASCSAVSLNVAPTRSGAALHLQLRF